MRRLLIHVEGESEENFVNNLLAPKLYSVDSSDISARLIGNARLRVEASHHGKSLKKRL